MAQASKPEALGLRLKKMFIEDIGRRPGTVERGYIGIIYGSFIKTNDGEVKLIEFNRGRRSDVYFLNKKRYSLCLELWRFLSFLLVF